ncbi:TetR family transcriptional regulator [Brevibacterium sanguinis]|uniref:TetR family transcriptional regulator n=2 Tax=Brevibacterium TaxID=1696 RepID=A0A366IM48_9MICO|nr:MULTISPECIES: TetR/AcrR family transcriptional regulator [Brevibacterium]RBP67273.1 TetR family transcriptional regulator [Brevibacterium sanguinis]RBP73798.1 TetR family transcriptional regulator [Brevibacterium celere]
MTTARDALLGKVLDYLIEHGVRDVSLRTLAANIGTSHRMLIYHFGSREGLLTAIVDHIWHAQQEILEQFAEAHLDDPVEGAWQFWQALVRDSSVMPLVFELSAAAMQGAPWRTSFQEGAALYIDRLSRRLRLAGVPDERAEVLARLWVSTARGALWELRLTGDVHAANATVRSLLDSTFPPSAN